MFSGMAVVYNLKSEINFISRTLIERSDIFNRKYKRCSMLFLLPIGGQTHGLNIARGSLMVRLFRKIKS